MYRAKSAVGIVMSLWVFIVYRLVSIFEGYVVWVRASIDELCLCVTDKSGCADRSRQQSMPTGRRERLVELSSREHLSSCKVDECARRGGTARDWMRIKSLQHDVSDPAIVPNGSMWYAAIKNLYCTTRNDSGPKLCSIAQHCECTAHNNATA